jgi:leukotriene-A4 hydrolase
MLVNESMKQPTPYVRDPHSFARPDQARIDHVSLDLSVSFSDRTLRGRATLRVAGDPVAHARRIILDTMDLKIERVWAGVDADHYQPVPFSLGIPDPVLGSALTIEAPANAKFIKI